MIRSFGDKRTERLFLDEAVREFQGLARRAKRKLEAVDAAGRLDDLAVPPSNRLEKLRGDLNDQAPSGWLGRACRGQERQGGDQDRDGESKCLHHDPFLLKYSTVRRSPSSNSTSGT